MPLINPTNNNGLQFGTTTARMLNKSGSTTGYGIMLVPDIIGATATSITPGATTNPYYNGKNVHIATTYLYTLLTLFTGIVQDSLAAGVPDGAECTVLFEGMSKAWVRVTAATVTGNNLRGAALGPVINTTNVNRFLCNEVNASVLAATYAGSKNTANAKKAAIALADLTVAQAAADSAEAGAALVYTGGSTTGTVFTGASASTMALTNYTCQWCDVLMSGILGFQ